MKSNLVKITKHYVINIETLTIYKVVLTKRGYVKDYEKCCRLIYTGGEYKVTDRKCEVAIGVIEKSKLIASKTESRRNTGSVSRSLYGIR